MYSRIHKTNIHINVTCIILVHKEVPRVFARAPHSAARLPWKSSNYFVQFITISCCNLYIFGTTWSRVDNLHTRVRFCEFVLECQLLILAHICNLLIVIYQEVEFDNDIGHISNGFFSCDYIVCGHIVLM